MKFLFLVVCSFALVTAYAQADTLHYPEETHFKNIQQLTFGGDNAEAYWSYDGKWIVFQRTSVKDGVPCDQIFVGKIPKKGEKFSYKMVSTGKGRTTCAFFTKDNKQIIYASTHESNATQITSLEQANWVPNFLPDGRIIFCSNHEYRRGFPFNMYVMKQDGTSIEKISRDKGFDAFSMFSYDGKKIIFSSSRNNGGTRIQIFLLPIGWNS